MHRFRPRWYASLIVATLMAAALPAVAQVEVRNDPPAVRPTGGFDRIFLGFAEDAILAQRQWWEAQVEMNEDAVGEVVDTMLIRGIVAFQPWERVEIGGRVGFGSSDSPPGIEDGTGATDLDAWGKYFIPGEDDRLDLAVGGMVTLPTGDDTAGLGFDSFAVGLFASARYRLDRFIIGGNAGFRVNGDGETLDGPDLEGETSPRLGAMILYPASDSLDFVGEVTFEGERFDDTDEDSRVLAGVNWRLGERNLVRLALSGGLTDGAPDWQAIAGYAVQFR